MADDEVVDDDTTDDEVADDEERAESRYRRRIGITLATLALLGAWIAVLQTNAATNESRTTREATRLAAEAQTANVVDRGVQSGLEQVAAESQVFPLRGAFNISEQAAAEVDANLDPARAETRLEAGQALVDGALGVDATRVTAISERARRLSLEQSAVVEQRITWNARASQYETVMTTLAIAIFLIGFTMVVGRKLRPPFVGPGVLLAVFCFGWAIHIYQKPIPEVDLTAIGRTASGQVALSEGRNEDALADFDEAVDADEEYAPAYEGRGLARMVVANPDLLTSLAITDRSPEVVDAASADLDKAFELGGTKDARTVAVAALTQIVAADWDRAAVLLEDAVEDNHRTPGLMLWRSAVAVAQDDESAADDWLDRAVRQLATMKGSDTNRKTAAQYLSLLSYVAEQVPAQAQMADQFRDDGVAMVAAAAAGSDQVEPDRSPPPAATLEIVTATFADGATTVQLASTGVPTGAQVVVAGYERPAPGASWVQPAPLFYVGPPGSGGVIEVPTPQVCAPVEFRFDLYVDGRFADSTTSRGGAPTC